MFVSKLDASGSFVWAKNFGGAMFEEGFSIALDGFSNIHVTGLFEGTADFDPGSGVYNLTSVGSADMFILKLNASGNFLWAKGIGGSLMKLAVELLSMVLGMYTPRAIL